MRFCKQPGCPAKVTSGYCPAHKRPPKRVKTKQDDFYSGAAWIRFRDWFRARHPLCRCGAVGTQVHHVIALPGGEAFAESNCENLCIACHNKEHDRFAAGKGKVYTYGKVQAHTGDAVFRF